MGDCEECIEERRQQRACSPGTVDDEENLARFVLHSSHVAPDGELAPAAFSVQEFMEQRRGGPSLARLDHMSTEEVRGRVKALPDRTTGAPTKRMAVAKAQAIRAMRSGGARLFCVVDDGLPDYHAHAAVRLADRQSASRSSVRRERKILMRAFALRSVG